ncbi:MAG: hypothetical protein ACREC0_06630 [Methylocella sp.]
MDRFFSKFARSVLRHTGAASKQQLEDRLFSAIDGVDPQLVVRTLSRKLDEAA